MRRDPSESAGSGFSGSFYNKFDGPKIKDFERSTLIKFEEFNGDQLESDPNRKYSERISDRIYESIDISRPILTTDENIYNNSAEGDEERP
jgi:hypothetical protein